MTCVGMPPTAEATTGLCFQRASATVRILQAVEAGDLRENGALRVDVKTGHDLVDERRFEIAVLLRQRIDRRIEEILGQRELPGKFRRGEDGPVVARHEAFEKG